MGPAHSTVVNHTAKRMCVLAFNNSDLLFTSYNCLYLIEPGESVLVEATPDAVGLKIGVVYDTIAETQEILFQRFACKNDSTIAIHEIDYDEISWDGDHVNGYVSGKLKERDNVPYTMACEAVANLEPTIGEFGGRFEKEPLPKRSPSISKSSSTNDLNTSLSSSTPLDKMKATLGVAKPAMVAPPSPSVASEPENNILPPVEHKSSTEKWLQETIRLKQIAEFAESKLARTKATQAEKARLAKEALDAAAAVEVAQAQEAQRKRDLEEQRRRDLQKKAEEEEEERLRREAEEEEAAAQESRRRWDQEEADRRMKEADDADDAAHGILRNRRNSKADKGDARRDPSVSKERSPSPGKKKADPSPGKLVPQPKKKKTKAKNEDDDDDDAGKGKKKAGKKTKKKQAEDDDDEEPAKGKKKKGGKKGKKVDDEDEDDGKEYVSRFKKTKGKKKKKDDDDDAMGSCGCILM